LIPPHLYIPFDAQHIDSCSFYAQNLGPELKKKAI